MLQYIHQCSKPLHAFHALEDHTACHDVGVFPVWDPVLLNGFFQDGIGVVWVCFVPFRTVFVWCGFVLYHCGLVSCFFVFVVYNFEAHSTFFTTKMSKNLYCVPLVAHHEWESLVLLKLFLYQLVQKKFH